MSPRVAAAAARKVPVSMRSGGTLWVAPCRCLTPSMAMVPVPAPVMWAPIDCSNRARSPISGSIAQFSSVVTPSARVAAINRFSVAVTEGTSNAKCAPRKRLALALRYPASMRMSAPSACSPAICSLTGREPMAQPPGSDTSASPKRASRGPSKRIDARIVFTSS